MEAENILGLQSIWIGINWLLPYGNGSMFAIMLIVIPLGLKLWNWFEKWIIL